MRTRSRGYAENEEEVPACDGNGDRVEQRPEKAREETEAGTRKEPATENEAEETLLQIEPRMMGMEVDGETEIRPVIDTQKVHSLAQQTEPKLSVDADVCNALIDYLDEFVGEVIDKLVLLYEMRGKKKLETSDLEIVLSMAHKIQYLPRPEHFRNDYAPPAKMRKTTSKRMFLYFGSMFSTAVCYFLIGWSCIFLIDYILRLKRCLPYLQFVNKYALEVSPFQIRFYTHRYTATSIVKSPQDGRVAEGPSNRAHAVHPQSSFHRVIATLWFSTGAAVSIICLFGITVYLTQMLLADISMLAAMRPKVAPFRVAPPFGVDAAIPVPAHQQPPVDAPENGSLKKLLNKPAAIEAEREKKQEHQLPNGPGPPEYDVLDEGAKEGGLVPIIPGWNLPWSHMPIFMVILCFAAIIHELGHSWAATSNGVQVNGFGFFFIAVYPGAFTEIDSLTLKKTAPFKRLMVYGAGIWHNLVMAGLAYLLFMATPSILSPLFLTGHGLTVKSVDARSGLHGPAGLSPGHIVDAIDECRVREMADWRECVRQLETQRNGRCIRNSRLDATRTEQTSMSIDELHCCDGFSNITQAHMCFESKEMMKVPQMATKAPSLNRLLNIGDDKEKRAKRQAPIKEQNATDNLNKSKEMVEDLVQNVVKVEKRVYNCMSARYVTDQPVCNSTAPCQQYKDDPDNRVCVYPALFNGTQLARITVRELDRPVLYVGSLDELIAYVRIDPLTRRYSWVDDDWAEAVELVPKYLFTLSLALGLLNAVPCYALDGQHIVSTLIRSVFSHWPSKRRNTLTSLVLLSGVILLASNVLIGFVKLAIL